MLFVLSLKKLAEKYLEYELVSIDEVSFQLTTNYKRIWFPRGERPKMAFFWSNKKLIVFAWLDPSKKYVFILDNAGFHKTQCVKNLLKEVEDWIVVEHIPPYSPELNQIETCWKVTKNV